MFCSTFFAMTLSNSEQQVHILTVTIIKQKPHKHLIKIKKQNTHVATNLAKYFKQSKETKKNWEGAEIFEISFCIIFDSYCKSFNFGRKTGTRLCLHPI